MKTITTITFVEFTEQEAFEIIITAINKNGQLGIDCYNEEDSCYIYDMSQFNLLIKTCHKDNHFDIELINSKNNAINKKLSIANIRELKLTYSSQH